MITFALPTFRKVLVEKTDQAAFLG